MQEIQDLSFPPGFEGVLQERLQKLHRVVGKCFFVFKIITSGSEFREPNFPETSDIAPVIVLLRMNCRVSEKVEPAPASPQ